MMDLLSVRTIVGFVASHRMCANSRNAIWIAKISFEYMDILSCAGEKIFEPKATGAYVFRFDCFFLVGIVLDHEGISSLSEAGIRH